MTVHISAIHIVTGLFIYKLKAQCMIHTTGYVYAYCHVADFIFNVQFA